MTAAGAEALTTNALAFAGSPAVEALADQKPTGIVDSARVVAVKPPTCFVMQASRAAYLGKTRVCRGLLMHLKIDKIGVDILINEMRSSLVGVSDNK